MSLTSFIILSQINTLVKIYFSNSASCYRQIIFEFMLSFALNFCDRRSARQNVSHFISQRSVTAKSRSSSNHQKLGAWSHCEGYWHVQRRTKHSRVLENQSVASSSSLRRWRFHFDWIESNCMLLGKLSKIKTLSNWFKKASTSRFTLILWCH